MTRAGHAPQVGHPLAAASPTRRRAIGTARREGAPGRGSRRRAGRSSGSPRRRARATCRRSVAAPCWRRSRGCAGADPALAMCGAGRRPRRSPERALADDAARAAPDDAGLVLEVRERRLPGRRVRLVDGAPGLVVAERVQEADALRDGEDEVEARRPAGASSPRVVARRCDGSIRSTVIVRAFGCRRRSRSPEWG